MGLITETSLRAELRNKNIDRYAVKPGIKITPSARQYLKERNIELVIEDESPSGGVKAPEMACPDADRPPRYILLGTDCRISEKPEYMTQLYGNKLVYKDHPRIALRGKIDSLQSQLLELQLKASRAKSQALVRELEEVLQYIRNILRCEVLEEELPASKLLGLDEKELREWSHHPEKHFGIKHILPSHDMGEWVLGLNSLRSGSREVELCAINAFKTAEGIAREDILRALNRLSSCFYVMMLKAVKGDYR